ncbi:MAG: hypothetical protein RJQ09_13275 [Cyclobacteriaceae bacterium]
MKVLKSSNADDEPIKSLIVGIGSGSVLEAVYLVAVDYQTLRITQSRKQIICTNTKMNHD